MDTTPQTVAHFAINADDVEASRRFYEQVIGWRFEPWGPPGFFFIHTSSGADPGPHGALQQRRDVAPGRPTTGFECTIAVADVDATAKAVVEHGCEVLMERTTISGVGHLIFFADPGGNVVGAMQYDDKAE